MFMYSTCLTRKYANLYAFLILTWVCTIANPENTTPETKCGKIVVCHPGITEVAKSKDTIGELKIQLA